MATTKNKPKKAKSIIIDDTDNFARVVIVYSRPKMKTPHERKCQLIPVLVYVNKSGIKAQVARIMAGLDRYNSNLVDKILPKDASRSTRSFFIEGYDCKGEQCLEFQFQMNDLAKCFKEMHDRELQAALMHSNIANYLHNMSLELCDKIGVNREGIYIERPSELKTSIKYSPINDDKSTRWDHHLIATVYSAGSNGLNAIIGATHVDLSDDASTNSMMETLLTDAVDFSRHKRKNTTAPFRQR